MTRHAGRSTAVAEAVMKGVADGKVYATGSTTCIVLQG
jgi:acyl-coenzyme A thioesterase PaaI-like protein